VGSGPFPDLLALAMVAVACFHATRLTLAVWWRRPTEADVDIVHTVMGVSMAGMLTGWLSGAWNDAWMVVFATAAVWFGRGLVSKLSGARAGAAVSHHLPHFVVSAVMLYMLWAMRWTSVAGSPMSSMGHVGGGLLLPTVVAVLVVGNAAIAAWSALSVSPGSPAVAPVVASGAPGRVVGRVSAGGARERAASMLAPRGAPACLLVMSVAMAYMVVVIHP
jgi:Domain of unknown function (DUF5134)